TLSTSLFAPSWRAGNDVRHPRQAVADRDAANRDIMVRPVSRAAVVVAVMSDIHVPAQGWWPRDHQMPLWEYMQAGGKRAIAIWHRRAGKDEIAMHHTAVQMLKRPGNYWHCLPEYAMARKAIFNSINPHS